jgi:glycosyltransferase involved in cell wall biosynthesis
MPLLPPEIGLRVAGTIWHEGEREALDNPRVSYLGPLDKDALVEEYRRALCVISPNIELPSGLFEGFGLVAPEAAASGGVLLAAATGGLVDAVIDGETGFLVPSSDADAWARKVLEVTKWSQETRQRFVERAMAKSREVYSWSRVASEVIEAYAIAGQK